MTAAAYQAVGSGHATSVAWPTHITGDLGVLVVGTSSAAGGALTTPSGWTPVAGFPLLLTRGLYVFTQRATSNAMGNAALTGTGVFWGVIFTIRNSHQVSPIHDSGRIPTSITSNPYCPGVLSAIDAVVVATLLGINSATTGGLVSAEANTTLSAYTERYDDGGGATSGALCVCTGDLANAGTIAESSSTAASGGYHRATLVFAPIADIPISGTVTIDGAAAPNSSGGNPKVYLYDLTQPSASYLVLDSATELTNYSLISGGTGAFAFKVPYSNHEYIAVYQDASGAIYGASQKLTFSGGAFPAAVITIKTVGAGSATTLVANNYEGEFFMRKNEATAADRVAGPIPFRDLDGALVSGLTFTGAECQIRSSTGAYANSTNSPVDNGDGTYRLQLTQAETNVDSFAVVKLAKTGYPTQYFAVPIRTWQASDSALLSTIAGYVDTEITSIISSLASLTTAVAALPTATAVRDAILAYAYRSGRTVKGLFRRLGAALETADGLKGTTVNYYQPDGTTVEFSVSQNTTSGTRSSPVVTNSEA